MSEPRRPPSENAFLEERHGAKHPWLEELPELEDLALVALAGGAFDEQIRADAARRGVGDWDAIEKRASCVARIRELFDRAPGELISAPFWAAWLRRADEIGVKL